MIERDTSTENFLDSARAEDFTDAQFLSCFAETPRERELIDRLKGPGAHLLEGPRGVGKSSLLKKTELEMDASYTQVKNLAVYVNFKASLLLETGIEDLGYNPFLCWVTAKVLDAFYKKCRKLQILTSDEIGERYRRLFGVNTIWSASNLERIISDLQSLTTLVTDDKRTEVIKNLSDYGLGNFANVEAIAEFVTNVMRDKKIERVNFLFDEAAHTFDEQHQEIFFQFFKLLHGGSIAVKAATYPGITYYGGNFEIGQDAVKLSISSIEENLEHARTELRNHFRHLLQKRIPSSLFVQLVARGEPLDLLIYLSNGNPRVFLQTVSKWIGKKEYSKRSALAASNDFIATELVNYHLGLKKRLPRFSSHIELGMDLIKAHLIPELQKKNEGKGPDPKIQTVYFTVDSTVRHKILRSLNLLEYSGFVYSKSVVKTAKRRQARRYAIHLGVAANEKVFHSSLSRDPDIAIKCLSVADYREFYASDERFKQLEDDHPQQETCPNGHVRRTDGAFCPICGNRFAVDRVVVSLLNDPVDRLSITDFLKQKLKKDFQANSVRDALTLTESQLMQATWIGPVRARQITNAAEEYITG